MLKVLSHDTVNRFNYLYPRSAENLELSELEPGVVLDTVNLDVGQDFWLLDGGEFDDSGVWDDGAQWED